MVSMANEMSIEWMPSYTSAKAERNEEKKQKKKYI